MFGSFGKVLEGVLANHRRQQNHYRNSNSVENFNIQVNISITCLVLSIVTITDNNEPGLIVLIGYFSNSSQPIKLLIVSVQNKVQNQCKNIIVDITN